VKPRTPEKKPSGPAQEKNIFGGSQNGLPLSVGSFIPSPDEAETLAKFGWKPGDPVPANFAKTYALAMAAAEQEANTFDPNYFKDVKGIVGQPSNPIDVNDLPPAKQQELAEALKLAKYQKEVLDKSTTSRVENFAPGVREAIQEAQKPITVEDDLDQISDSNHESKSDQIDQAGATNLLKNCPHCGWDLSRDKDIVPSQEDKIGWLICMEGNKRFTKQYSLLGGTVSVIFRVLTSKESDLAWRQTAIDAKRSPMAGQDEYWRNLMTYRMVMAIEKVTSRSGGPVENPPIHEWDIPSDCVQSGDTRLPTYLTAITDDLLSLDSMRRVIGNAFHEFGLLVEKLEVLSSDDSFWQGIEQPV
jgi:hypothetical protein